MALDRSIIPALDRNAARRRVPANLRGFIWHLLVFVCLFYLSISHCTAASLSEWDDCKSQDMAINIPACTFIVEDASTSEADRIAAYNLRAAAYLRQHSYIFAGRDFSSIIKLDPRNIAALGGRAITNFRRNDRDQAVMDYSIAKRLDPRKLDAMVASSDDLKEIADYAAQSPPPKNQLDAALDALTAKVPVCQPGFRLDASTCVPVSCPVGQRLDGGSCVPIVCWSGYRLDGSSCVAITCPAGQRLEGSTCVQLWNSVAGGIWKVKGNVHVAIGYSGLQTSAQEARDSAESFCRQSGRNCKAVGAWTSGCVYIVVGSNRGGAGWSSAATTDEAMRKCRSNGYSCKAPIGGCVD